MSNCICNCVSENNLVSKYINIECYEMYITRSLMHSLTQSLTKWLTHSFTHSLTYSLTHSLH